MRHHCELCGTKDAPHVCDVVMMTPEEEREVLAVLNGVTRGQPAVPLFDLDSIATYSGWPAWLTRTGWTVVVFNDCGSWDYIDRIEAPDGRSWDYPFQSDGHPMTQAVADWTPDDGDPFGWPGAPP